MRAFDVAIAMFRTDTRIWPLWLYLTSRLHLRLRPYHMAHSRGFCSLRCDDPHARSAYPSGKMLGLSDRFLAGRRKVSLRAWSWSSYLCSSDYRLGTKLIFGTCDAPSMSLAPFRHQQSCRGCSPIHWTGRAYSRLPNLSMITGYIRIMLVE